MSTERKPASAARSVRQDLRSDTEVMQELDKMRQDERYARLLPSRRRLPAFASKDSFLAMLDQSRVVVVVGETGSGKTTQCERVPKARLTKLMLDLP
jgi:ATP-dependent RNA helicase DHX57